MKFIYYSDFHLPVEQVISGGNLTDFFVIEDIESTDIDALESQTLIVVFDKPLPDSLLHWRKHQSLTTLKIVLISNALTDEALRNLQLEHGFYDLYFKYPVPFQEIENKVKLISTFTQNVWSPDVETEAETIEKKIEPTLQMGEIEIANFVDEVSDSLPPIEMESPHQVSSQQEVQENLEEINLVDGLTEDTNLPSMSIERPIEISEDKNLLDLPEQDFLQDHGVEALSQDVEWNLEQNHNTDLESVASLNSSNLESIEGLALTQEQESGVGEELSIAQPVTEEAVNAIENVSLNEILENKDDKIYRLMSKNKMLEEEVIEKEEIIRKLQKEFRELQSVFDKNKSLVEESTFQTNVLKNNHEQEKLEIKKNLEVSLAKIKLLEARIEELKAHSPPQSKEREATLSVGELRKLKARQEHLEEKISLLQSDSAIQLQHREKKIIDLKRRIDLLEFDVKDSLEREAELKRKLQVAESKMAQTKQLLKQVMEDSSPAISNDIVKKNGSYDV